MFFAKKTDIPSLNAQECLDMIGPGSEVLLLDVRRAEEYAEASIPGSMHLELAEILNGKWADLLPYKDKGIILQCHSGVRSLEAARYLAAQDFRKLWNMEGGILAYQELCDNSSSG
ncbi:rhodanese-like domain-containing protein [Candidatus Haliotispira prima]|uniref:Rhodanese-like domain-containing protein n=1 Tax=Candidatus Haliotispira prima TaxID=3034016 RepID=A0ABY8MG49_9SPIO|nr:rhodanese-like domain-containing protein [Candidatus Haliotispira prima]